MAGDAGSGDAARAPIYVVELRRDDEGAEVAIAHVPCGTGGEVGADVWAKHFADLEVARTVVRVMLGRPDRWAVWARMARILGPDFLTGLIEAEVVAAVETAAEEERARSARERRRTKAREAERVEISFVSDHPPRIVARRGGHRFLLMEFDSMVMARRVWDWVRWQEASLRDWFAFARSKGSFALERFILESMAIEESRLKGTGLSPGGRRPLRYWRPMDEVYRRVDKDGFGLEDRRD